MNDQKRGFEEGCRAASYFGAEFVANGSINRLPYLNDAAWYFGKDCFVELTKEEKLALHTAFNEGCQKEKLIRRNG